MNITTIFKNWLRPVLFRVPASAFRSAKLGTALSARAGFAFPVGTDTSASVPRSTLAGGRPRVCVTKSPAGDRKNAFIMELLSQIAYWTAYTAVVGGIIIIFGGKIVRDTVEMFKEQPQDEDQPEETQEETL